MSRLGLRGRLVATTVAAAAVAVAVLVIGLQALLAHQSTQESLSVLRSRADAAASTVRVEGGRIRVLETPRDSLDQNIWVFDADGRRVDGAPPPRLRGPVDRLGRADTERSVALGGRYRLLARPVTSPGGATSAVVVAGMDLTPYETSERRGLWLSLGLGLLTVVAAGAAAYLASGYALRQVRRMAHRADEWREHDLSGRFAMGTPRDELTELGDTLDRMLDRITQAILTERRLTDEVAHELRTPLTVIRSEAQLALQQPDQDAEATVSLEAIVAATHRMTASIETMLAVARSAHADEQLCHPADVLTHIREHASNREGVRLEVGDAGPDAVIAAPLRVVGAALAPLLDNAVRHAATRVRVHVTTHARRVELHVEDDGEGVDEEHRAHIFDPGHTSAADGAGLGLALTRRLAHSVGGEVSDRGDGHGHFVLSLPRD
jgi:signal transduction histidine kinase